MNPELLRKSIKLMVAAFLTAAAATYFERIAFVWYPLLAVVIVVDDNDEQTIAAARSRILGTIAGGLVTFLVHTILSGWIGVLVAMVLILPVLRILGWQSGLSTAVLVSVMFLMIPSHAELNWFYVFNRAVDTSVGCAIALLVGLLLWPRNRLDLLVRSEADLCRQLRAQLQAYRGWLEQGQPRPQPLAPAGLTGALQRMESWVALERRGPGRQRLDRQRWRQRLLLWTQVQHHWIQWERLLGAVAAVPELGPSLGQLDALLARSRATAAAAGAGPALPAVTALWRAAAALAPRPLPLLAVAEELDPLLAGLTSLARLHQGCRP
ncbi:MAG: hypothetical protein RLZZ336_1411 [Cyanobacteriota bacterium]|jgi:uncharacterized membrane protein YccC